jgi:osmotically-inducible protein OsmY
MSLVRAPGLPLAVVAAALLGSCAAAPPRPSVRSPTEPVRVAQGAADEVLASTVYAELNADPIYYFRHVDVTVDHGVADLSGYVWSTDALYRARKIARSVPGVSRVVTARLELERQGFSGGRSR